MPTLINPYMFEPPDYTPDAVNWGNISGDTPASNADQTITGVNQTLNLRATCGTASGSATGTLRAYVNGANTASVTISTGAQVNFTATVNDLVHFACTASGSPGDTRSAGTVTVTNQSDGGATLDTFTATVSVPV